MVFFIFILKELARQAKVRQAEDELAREIKEAEESLFQWLVKVIRTPFTSILEDVRMDLAPHLTEGKSQGPSTRSINTMWKSIN